MRIFATLKIAFRALKRNKLRTALTMLGMIIGVGAVIAMVSIGNGAKAQVEAQIASLGQNIILIFSGSTTRGGVNSGWGSAGTLTIEDADSIQREISGVASVSPEIRTVGQLAAGSQNWSCSMLGEGPDYLTLRDWPLMSGAMFTEADVRSAGKVALLGKTTAQQLFAGEDPVGQIVRVRNVPFIITGVLSSKGMSVMGSDQDDVLIIPYTTAMKRITGSTTLRGINVQVSDATQLARVQNQIIELLRQRHKIQPGRDDDFTVRSQEEIAERANEASKVMRGLLAGIAGVSLVVGGIGIMNIMLVSVTERTREIGIRMAVGARSGDILMQFLIEAITLSSLGGLLGIATGIGTSLGLAKTMGWPTFTSADSVIIAFFFSAAVGIFFGFYPARKASQLDPIDALRYE
ncbi:MAG TPA: ABC transporter permease [Roseimicrobium sp.]|nr:ABC transporter permease [Roseimicrobium sp.]